MAIEQNRIEAAASLMRQFDLFALEAEGAWVEAAKALLAAAYPELASDPPTGWVEQAARAICEADVLSPAPDAPIMWNGKQAKAWEPRAAILRQAIDAGLFCHPAKAWVAPMEDTEAMWGGLARQIVMWDRFGGSASTGAALHLHLKNSGYEVPDWLTKLIPPVAHTPPKGAVAGAIYRAMRDAHLKEQGHE